MGQSSQGGPWVRPDDDAVVAMSDALRWHWDYIRDGGYPVAALIVEAVLADVTAGGPLSEALPTTTRFGDLPSLRVMAAVHRLALERRSAAVALHLPTLGGTPPHGDEARGLFRRAVVDALVAHPAVLAASLGQTPQTNETGRAALLRCALSRLDPAMPVRLREIGTSAGLNLRADHLPGLPGLEAGPLPRVEDRIGCDLHPIDPSTADGRTRLSSYIWVDDVERFERLRRALIVASQVPATVVTADAADFVEELELHEGSTTVVWHSAFWLYLDRATRDRINAGLERLGAQADARRPLAHASWEWSDFSVDQSAPFALVLRTWTGSPDDGRPEVLATGNSHGHDAFLSGR